MQQDFESPEAPTTSKPLIANESELYGVSLVSSNIRHVCGSQETDSEYIATRTSGSTGGNPKRVLYSKSRFLLGMQTVADVLGLCSDREGCCLVPRGYAYGLSVLVSHGIAAEPLQFYGDDELELIATKTGDLDVYLTPAQATRFLAQLSGLRSASTRLIFAGGKLASRTVETIVDTLGEDVRIVNMYGLAEAGPRVSIRETSVGDFIEGNVGRPIKGVEVAQTDHGTVGVRSAYQMVGMMDDRQCRCVDWIDTGDLGVITADGEVVLEGRSLGHTNYGGRRIAFSDLVQIVRSVPGVLDASVSASVETLVVRVASSPSADRAKLVSQIRSSIYETYSVLRGRIDVDINPKLSEAGKL